jgi:hypothetical protein
VLNAIENYILEFENHHPRQIQSKNETDK